MGVRVTGQIVAFRMPSVVHCLCLWDSSVGFLSPHVRTCSTHRTDRPLVSFHS